MQIPDAGEVRIIRGNPGSGKTLYVVKEIVRTIQHDRRPVFTNVPFRWPVVRQYLRVKFGEEYARLIFPLTQEHFRAFIDRQQAKAREREAWKLERRLKGLPLHEADWERRWEAGHGLDLVETTEGQQPNWIYPASLLVIDEAHEWFPQQTQSGGSGTRSDSLVMQTYLTKLCHHLHNCWFITQDEMQLNIAARRLASYYTVCRRRDEDELLPFIRFRTLRLIALGCGTFTREQWEGQASASLTGMEPLHQETILPRFQRHWFRLYSSFTHVGSTRRMSKALDDVRRRLGVFDADLRVRQQQEAEMRAKGIRRIFKWAKRAALTACWVTSLVLVFGIGRSFSQVIQTDPVVPDGPRLVLPEGARVMGWTRKGVVVGSELLEPGDTYAGAEVLFVDRPGRRVFFGSADGVFSWSGGEPRFLGSPEDVAGRLRDKVGSVRLGEGLPQQPRGTPEG